MITYVHRHRVRYRECDPMGVVYHTHYLDWFEAARTEALRSQGVAYASLEADGVIMPVIEATLKYHASARYDDEVEITATFLEVPRVRVTIDYAVRREGEERVLVSGRDRLVLRRRRARAARRGAAGRRGRVPTRRARRRGLR